MALLVYRTFPLAPHPIPVGVASTRITVTATGDAVQVLRDGAPVGEVPLTDPEIEGGRVLLGLFTERNPATLGPYEVAFDNVSIFGRDAN